MCFTASALFSVTITAVLQALPMVQAMLLLGIYALLPMIVVLSRFSLSMMVVGADGHLTVKFWSVLLVPGHVGGSEPDPVDVPGCEYLSADLCESREHDTKRMLLNMITTSLYLGLPLLWSGMMAWAGVNIGRSITSVQGEFTRPAHDAGRQGGNIGKSVVTKGGKR